MSAPPVSRAAPMSRRGFLRTASGIIGLSVLGLPGRGQGADVGVPAPLGPVPGVAAQRIEGLAKVTGEKVYARDFRARDMAGWPDHQWHALFLRARTTQEAFLGLDLSSLPSGATPTRVVLGSDLEPGFFDAPVEFRRDLHIDALLSARAEEQRKTAKVGSFNLPDGLSFDLLVRPGTTPNFLGQAVALLLFDSLATYRAARRFLAGDDGIVQRYGPGDGPDGTPLPEQPFDPRTLYVKDPDFDYAGTDAETYAREAPQVQARIREALDAATGLIRQPIRAEMRAMDPMFMEPEAGLAWIDPARKEMQLVLGTQSPDGDVRNIASMFGSKASPVRDLSQVTLHSCYPGGGFGGRDSSPFSLMLALAVAFAEGNPVRLAYDRFEQFRVGLKRHATVAQGTLYAHADMRLEAVRLNMVFDGGGRRNLSPYVASLGALCAGGSYRLPVADIHAEALHTENISGGSQRGFGGPQAYFAIETALDDLAAAQGWDPMALRRANLIAEGDTTVTGGPIEQSLNLSEMLDIAEAHPLWAERAAIRAGHEAEGRTYGTGLAMSLQAYGTSGDGMVAAVHLERDGTLTVQSDAVDMGNGSATTLGVTIGPILGANAARVEMGGYTLFAQTGLSDDSANHQRWSDPMWTQKGTGSSSACLTGLHQVNTVQQTAQALLRGSLLVGAAKLWGRGPLSADEVVWEAGALRPAGGGGAPLTLATLARAVHEMGLPTGALGHAYFQNVWAEADFDTPGGALHLQLDGLAYYRGSKTAPLPIPRRNGRYPAPETQRYSRYVWAPCVNVVGLTLDRASGRVQIENVLSVLNAGHIHVPEMVSGQSQGGVAMAIGYSLLEDMPPGMAGPADGRWNLNRYHVARAGDVPLGDRYVPGARAQELITIPQPEGSKRVGRGIAEAVMCSIPPAISNALRDATGVRFASLPITPEKILGELAP
ncbi:xanthine dehydrogenase family protein molybdopterin-binding subunit [Salipiger bermudensis]|uniref:xanthine dehydrogenase family protein molybdopterin-binding subunit n=1 Tax=Salipiger bermudensis TaxID=344736 RepID=UPI001CD8152D|nr:molybdopterin cofactor-binding domain-containing protein [Salipiger bermudensis]MCA0960835.1 molybdopterin-dependent oxidoreductase [Salipiger bermudensis]